MTASIGLNSLIVLRGLGRDAPVARKERATGLLIGEDLSLRTPLRTDEIGVAIASA